MASTVPEYFLPRNWDYLPGGPIKLGNVLTSLKEPHRPIVTVQPDADAIVTSSKDLVAIETENAKSGGVTFVTTFLNALLGAGVDVSTDVEQSSGKVFTFDKLETCYINTTDENSESAETSRYQSYIERCVNAPLVLRYLERCRFHKHVYVITGVKVVRGAKCYTSAARTVNGSVGAQVDGTILTGGMVPLGGGPEIHGGRSRRFSMSWEGSTEFVLAYKVSKVTVNKAGTVKKEGEAIKGAFMEDAPTKSNPNKLSVRPVDQLIDEDGFTAVAVDEGEGTVRFGVLEGKN